MTSRKTEIKKYGSVEAYSDEMSRRRGMVKTVGLANVADKQKRIDIARLGGLNRWKNHVKKPKAIKRKKASENEEEADGKSQTQKAD